MSGLTNAYVEKIGKKILGNIFLGVFPCDLHPNIKQKKIFCLIFNLSKHDKTGSHFVAIFASKNELIYFDPFGNKLENTYILSFVKKNIKNRTFIENKACIQSCSSIFCGFYCISFLLSQKMKMPLEKYLSLFDENNLDKNEKISIDFIQKNY